MNRHLAFLTAMLLAASAGLEAIEREVCELAIRTCAANLDGKAFSVPDRFLSIAPTVGYCPVKFEKVITVADKGPSIVIILDNTGSMKEADKDPNLYRYDAAFELVKSLYAIAPATEISLVFFKACLCFTPSREPLTVPFGSCPGGFGYLPLLTLNRVYGDGRTGYQIITGILENKSWMCGPSESDPSRSMPGLCNGTDITLGFQAAAESMSKSTNPPGNRFYVLFSDGSPSNIDSPERVALKSDFVTNVANVPTTFTIWFGRAPAQQLVDMTANIQNNNYSGKNRFSGLWSISAQHLNPLDTNKVTYDYTGMRDSLFRLVETVMIPTIIDVVSHPATMILNQESTSVRQDSLFRFDGSFPLQAGQTALSLKMRFNVTDTSGGVGKEIDTTLTYSFTVTREHGVALPPEFTEGSTCRIQQLTARYSGTAIQTVSEDMAAFEIRFSPGMSLPTSTIQVEVTSSIGKDAETVVLGRSGPSYSATVPRFTSSTAVPGDGKLQHDSSPGERIVITYRDPAVPLDTLQETLRFVPYRAVHAVSAAYLDRDRDGLIDAVRIVFDGDIAQSEAPDLKDRIRLPAGRSLTIDSVRVSGGIIDCFVSQPPSTVPNTSVTSVDKIAIAETVPGTDGYVGAAAALPIADSLAPVIIYASVAWESTAASPPVGVLTVTYSESMDAVQSGIPFAFETGTGIPYGVSVTGGVPTGPAVQRYTSISFDNGGIVREGDRIWLSEPARVGDSHGNVQKEPNRKTAVRVEAYPPHTWVADVAPSPFTPGASPIPSRIASLPGVSGRDGVVVRIRPSIGILADVYGITGTATVYDAVGNVVVNHATLVMGPEAVQSALYFVWDGRNRGGRLVGSGTYVAAITTTDVNNNRVSGTVKIGVRR